MKRENTMKTNKETENGRRDKKKIEEKREDDKKGRIRSGKKYK